MANSVPVANIVSRRTMDKPIFMILSSIATQPGVTRRQIALAVERSQKSIWRVLQRAQTAGLVRAEEIDGNKGTPALSYWLTSFGKDSLCAAERRATSEELAESVATKVCTFNGEGIGRYSSVFGMGESIGREAHP